MSSEPSFIDRCVAGDAALEQIDDLIETWHAVPGGAALPDFLGMTKDEYSIWVLVPDTLAYIVEARRAHTPLADAVRHACRDFRDAKTGDRTRAARLESWLDAHGVLRFA